jgi:tetraacyldisaccharide 4'-kinase
MKAHLARWIESVWYTPKGLQFAAMYFLAPLTLLYYLFTSLRSLAYRSGLLACVDNGVFVVVVGNITTGGTGKTPIVIWLTRQLQAEGFTPGVVSRGYGGKRADDVMAVTADSSPAEVGDEPFLIHRATGFPVQVGADRVAAVKALLSRSNVDVVVSDDGLQHYRLGRKVELVVVDSSRGLGNGWLLPSGPLRELPHRLSSVDALLFNGKTGAQEHGDLGLTNAKDLPKDILEGSFGFVPGPAVNLKTGEYRGLDKFSGLSVRALAGIGNPKRFYDLLRRFDIASVPMDVEDHGMVDMAHMLTEGGTVLMTEKDAVKYSANADENCWYVPVRAVFEPEVEQRLIQTVCSKLRGETLKARKQSPKPAGEKPGKRQAKK